MDFKTHVLVNNPGGAAAGSGGGGVVRSASFKRPRRGGGGGGKKAVGAVFKESLGALLRMLHATSPHFIRCVKPNFRQAAGAFDGAYVLQQLQMMGMIHVVHARKLGYAHRFPFERFRGRYDYLWRGIERPSAAACAPYYSRHLGAVGAPDGERKECVTLLAAMALSGQLDEQGWAVGVAAGLKRRVPLGEHRAAPPAPPGLHEGQGRASSNPPRSSRVGARGGARASHAYMYTAPPRSTLETRVRGCDEGAMPCMGAARHQQGPPQGVAAAAARGGARVAPASDRRDAARHAAVLRSARHALGTP